MSDDIHVSAASLPASIVATSYVEMRDQDNRRWFWWASDAGNLTQWHERPLGINLASGRFFHWLRWQSPNGTNWWIYPSPNGTFTLQPSPLSIGQGTSQTWPWWWSPLRKRWALSVSNNGALVLTGTGEIITDRPHHILACPRCSWVGHIDRSNAMRINFEPQYNRCPRDGTILWEDEDEEWA